MYNLFAQNSLGSWEFDNFEGFENREVGNFRGNYDFSYDNAYTNNARDTAYDAVRYTSAIYLEDTFYVTDDVEVTAGFRYERLSSDDKPTLNASFVETYGFSNQNNLDGLSTFMPRASFKWYTLTMLPSVVVSVALPVATLTFGTQVRSPWTASPWFLPLNL